MPVDQSELGRRIRTAREACGLTQEALAQQCSLSRVAVVQIEQGNRAVSSLELDRIAFVLGHDISDFFAERFNEQDALVALLRLDPQIAKRTEVIEALRQCLKLGHEMTNLERLLRIDRAQLLTASYDLPIPRMRWDAIQQGDRIATEERQRLGFGVVPLGDVTDLLESQGVRTGVVELPGDISGMTLSDSKAGIFVVVNQRHGDARRRFSMCHEYGHVLMDRDRFGAVSREGNRDEIAEVRANAFAASFLMPAEGVRQFIAGLGKGRPSRASVSVYDEKGVIDAEGRETPGSQELQLYDVVLLADHFGVSRISAVYSLKNLREINDNEFERLKSEDETHGSAIAEHLGLSQPNHEVRNEFQRRFLGLALEAYRREEITRSKFVELGAMVGVKKHRMDQMLASAGLDDAA